MSATFLKFGTTQASRFVCFQFDCSLMTFQYIFFHFISAFFHIFSWEWKNAGQLCAQIFHFRSAKLRRSLKRLKSTGSWEEENRTPSNFLTVAHFKAEKPVIKLWGLSFARLQSSYVNLIHEWTSTPPARLLLVALFFSLSICDNYRCEIKVHIL